MLGIPGGPAAAGCQAFKRTNGDMADVLGAFEVPGSALRCTTSVSLRAVGKLWCWLCLHREWISLSSLRQGLRPSSVCSLLLEFKSALLSQPGAATLSIPRVFASWAGAGRAATSGHQELTHDQQGQRMDCGTRSPPEHVNLYWKTPFLTQLRRHWLFISYPCTFLAPAKPSPACMERASPAFSVMGQVPRWGSAALGAVPPLSAQPCSCRSQKKDAEGPASLAPPGSFEPSRKALKIHSLQGIVCYNLFSYESRNALPP